jgi:hypothetical protein
LSAGLDRAPAALALPASTVTIHGRRSAIEQLHRRSCHLHPSRAAYRITPFGRPSTIHSYFSSSAFVLVKRPTMATQFSTATAIPQHAPYQHHAYRKSTQYSPNGSAVNTPMNISPSSPRTTQLPLQRHQGIYQPRTAIGIPAALRKTEKPSSKSPPKLDSGVGSPNSGWQVNGGLQRTGTDDSATPSSRVGNEDMLSIYNQEPLSPTSGPITRNHWQVCYYSISFQYLCRS